MKEIIGNKKELAKKLLLIRDAIIQEDYDEAYHQLYSIASPNFDKDCDNVWKELEELASLEAGEEKCIDDCDHRFKIGSETCMKCNKLIPIDTILMLASWADRELTDEEKQRGEMLRDKILNKQSQAERNEEREEYVDHFRYKCDKKKPAKDQLTNN